MKHQNNDYLQHPGSKETMISSDAWKSTNKKGELLHLEASLNKMTNKVSRDEMELITNDFRSHIELINTIEQRMRK